MSTKIGGPHRCNIHPDFPETDDTELFNEHCRTTEGHSTSGSYPCSTCGCEIRVDQIPHQDLGKEVILQCPECYSKSQDLNKLINEQNEQRIIDQEIQTQQQGARQQQ